ncbi:MAG: VWA domain-containing protein, partial [Lachnospiraceae bacterium]|nr:VWA domain-containing protein [Lachnospiraceae bacterium]
MIFESLWPLLFLVAVPIIIILYLLKPRGEDYRISSNLLWQKLLKNQQSKTFFEKFIHNILMYLQLLIVVLLMIALMAPFIRMDGKGGGRKILLLDTSGSMQHENASGKTRLEEAVEQACDYVRTMENTRFSVVTADATGVELLAVDVTDTAGLVKTLQQLRCSDSGGNLQSAQSILDTLAGENAEDGADLLVFTDGCGAADFESLHSVGEKELYVVGEASANVANEYMVFSRREDGLYDVMVSLANYSEQEVTLDIGLHEEDGELIALASKQLAPSEKAICLFEGIDWQGETIEAEISGITFAGGARDSLEADNVTQAVKTKGNLIHGLLVGAGNIFLEKAYEAVTGESVAKSDIDILAEDSDYNVVIYDAGQAPTDGEESCLIFGDGREQATETLSNVVLDMTDCDLTAGLSGFRIGVNKAYCFILPEGAESFLEYEGKCVGYYGEINGRKEVVVGFDIRESDFPLRAEFPVFLANAMTYLSDTSWLATNVYYAGETLALQPWAEPDADTLPADMDKAGLYTIGNETYQEDYVVRFQSATESDGQVVAMSVIGSGELRMQKVKQTLRNVFVVLVLVFLVLEWIVYVRQMRYKGKFYLVVRGAVVLCLVLALLGLQVRLGGSKTATVFLVDLSNSNEEHLEVAEGYLRKTIEAMPAGNSYGIVTFGKDTQIEQFVTTEKYYGGLMTLPEKTATNFEEAVSKALTLIPAEAGGRLVVLTDGKETKGDIQRMAQALTNSQTELLTLLYEDEMTQDAYVDNVTVPSYLHPGDKYTIDVVVESNYSTDAVIALYNGSSLVSNNSVHLNKGSNRFLFTGQVSSEADSNAMESIRVQVLAEGDTCSENDAYNAYSVVEAKPRILVISGRDTSVSAFNAVLNAAGCDYSTVSALNAP